MTAFVALLALDAERIRQRRCDAAPCIQLPASLLEGDAGRGGDKERDGQGRQNGQSGQDGQAMAQEGSGEVPVSTQGMYRESSSSAPAGMLGWFFPADPDRKIALMPLLTGMMVAMTIFLMQVSESHEASRSYLPTSP